jgi:uncharacterized membrane protein
VENRPIIKLELYPLDRVFEIVCPVIIAFLWIYTIMSYSQLPDTIPTHFNASGKVDGYGSKMTILLLPVIGTVLYIAMTIINMYPHIFNYPVNITNENAKKQYTYATRLIRYLKTTIILTFSFIVYKSVTTATGSSEGLGIGFLPFFLGLVFIPLIIYFFKTFRKGNKVKDNLYFK